MNIDNSILNEKIYQILATIEKSLRRKELNESFLLLDLKEFDNDIIKALANQCKEGNFLKSINYLKITPFLIKIKKSTKSFIKNKNITNDKIEALHINALKALYTLKEAIKNEKIEIAYSTILSYEKIADEIYKEFIKDIKKENIEDSLKLLNTAKKLEKISDNVKTIAKYMIDN